jgi:hypothetical protein
MKITGSVVAVFAAHHTAETAVNRLAAAGFEMKHVSVVGRGYQSDETVIGFYGTGKSGKFSRVRGTFWGGLWALFLGGIYLTTPLLGHVVILGYLATKAFASLETPVIFGGLSAVGAALYEIGIPADSARDYEAAMRADGFLVMVHGTAATMISAKILLGKLTPHSLDMHVGGERVGLAARFG